MFGGAIGRFRELRRRFEQAIPAAAVSMDGRSFSYQLSIGSTVPPPGGFVALVSFSATIVWALWVGLQSGAEAVDQVLELVAEPAEAVADAAVGEVAGAAA